MAKADTPEFKPRRTEPGTTFGYTTPEGDQKTIHADDDGLVTARNAFEENVLVSQGLSVARIDKAADKAETEGKA